MNAKDELGRCPLARGCLRAATKFSVFAEPPHRAPRRRLFDVCVNRKPTRQTGRAERVNSNGTTAGKRRNRPYRLRLAHRPSPPCRSRGPRPRRRRRRFCRRLDYRLRRTSRRSWGAPHRWRCLPLEHRHRGSMCRPLDSRPRQTRSRRRSPGLRQSLRRHRYPSRRLYPSRRPHRCRRPCRRRRPCRCHHQSPKLPNRPTR